MGIDMITMVLPLPKGSSPDWDAAARAVRDLRLEVLWDTDYIFEWERWLDDLDDLPGARSAFVALRAAQAELYDHACVLRGALEHGWPVELMEIETTTHRIWITGGPSSGEDPGELINPAICLGEAGITDALGFESYTRYEDPPISERSFGFDAADLRRTRFGTALAHVAEEAAGLTPIAETARGWFDLWLEDLDRLAAPGADGRALLRFAACGLRYGAWLWEERSPLTPERLDDIALDVARRADESGLLDKQFFDSLPVLALELQERFGYLAHLSGRVDALEADPRGGAEGVRDVLASAVITFSLELATAALVDLFVEAGPLLSVPPAEITPTMPENPRGRSCALDQFLAAIVVDEVDWTNAEAAVHRLDDELRAERLADLEELRQLVGGSYRRYATEGPSVGSRRVFIAASHGRAGVTDVALGIGRLGRDGVLDEAGVVAWSAPRPDGDRSGA